MVLQTTQVHPKTTQPCRRCAPLTRTRNWQVKSCYNPLYMPNPHHIFDPSFRDCRQAHRCVHRRQLKSTGPEKISVRVITNWSYVTSSVVQRSVLQSHVGLSTKRISRPINRSELLAGLRGRLFTAISTDLCVGVKP